MAPQNLDMRCVLLSDRSNDRCCGSQPKHVSNSRINHLTPISFMLGFQARLESLRTEQDADDALQRQFGGHHHHDCACDCHAIVAAGREAVLEKLREGVDFSPLFSPDRFETSDMDVEQMLTLDSFVHKLECKNPKHQGACEANDDVLRHKHLAGNTVAI